MTSARLHTDQHHSDATPHHESALTDEDVEHARRYIVTDGGRAYPIDTRKVIDAYRKAGKEPNVVTDWTDLDERIEATRVRSTYLCTHPGCNKPTPTMGLCAAHDAELTTKTRKAAWPLIACVVAFFIILSLFAVVMK